MGMTQLDAQFVSGWCAARPQPQEGRARLLTAAPAGLPHVCRGGRWSAGLKPFTAQQFLQGSVTDILRNAANRVSQARSEF